MRFRSEKRGFAVLDGVFIVILIAGSVVLFFTGAWRADLLEKEKQLRSELKQIDAAVSKAAENGQLDAGTEIPFDDYRKYLKKSSKKRLREKGQDPFGNLYGEQRAGFPAQANPASRELLSALNG